MQPIELFAGEDQGAVGLFESCRARGKVGGLPRVRSAGLPKRKCLVEQRGAFFQDYFIV